MVCKRRYYNVPAIVGAALAIAATSPKVAAQEAPSQTPPRETAEDSGDIIVTAQRREERLIDVPISVTALSAEALETAGITDTAEIDMVTPGLRMDMTGGFVQPAIRGVTTTLSGGGDANVATYLDGVYQPTMLQALFSLRDVKTVEVLKGPQGTLFGRNATGGAILVTTLAPDLERITGDVALGYSSFGTFNASEFVSVPIVKGAVAASLSSSYENMSSGYIKDLLNRDTVGRYSSAVVRGKIRFIPWEGADFTLTGVYSDIKDGLIYTRTSYQGHNSRAALALAQGLPLADEPYEYSGDVDSYSKLKYWSTSLRGNIQVGPGTLTTTTAYVNNDQENLLDSDNIPLSVVTSRTTQKTKSVSQELIYSTDQLGRFHGIVGFFYIDKDVDGATFVNNFVSVAYGLENIKAWSLFGEATYNITDRLSITGGLRYSSETYTGGRSATTGGVQVRPPVTTFLTGTWTSVDPRASIRYELSPRSNVYFTYSQGFKSGFFNLGQVQPVNPERIKAYEIGYKGALGDGVLLNIAAFYYDYKDLQQLIRTTDANGLVVNIVQNAAVARIKGVEVSGEFRASDELKFTFGMTYLDARFTSFPGALVTVWTPPTTISQVAINAAGNRMVRSPEFSGNVTASYKKETSAGAFSASTTLYASSKVYHEAGNRVVEDPFVKLNASISFEPARYRGLKLSVFGKNLANSATILATTFSTAYDAFSYERPRSIGGEVAYKF